MQITPRILQLEQVDQGQTHYTYLMLSISPGTRHSVDLCSWKLHFVDWPADHCFPLRVTNAYADADYTHRCRAVPSF
jgi:hypothetical protein